MYVQTNFSSFEGTVWRTEGAKLTTRISEIQKVVRGTPTVLWGINHSSAVLHFCVYLERELSFYRIELQSHAERGKLSITGLEKSPSCYFCPNAPRMTIAPAVVAPD